MPKQNPKHRKKTPRGNTPGSRIQRPRVRYPAWLTNYDPKKLETEGIFTFLNRLGIEITPEQFCAQVNRISRRFSIVEDWRRQLKEQNQFHLLDYLEFSNDLSQTVKVLWHRLVPKKQSMEDIDELMQKGYDHYPLDDSKAREIWLEVWMWIETQITETVSSIDILETVFRGSQSKIILFNV